MLSRFDAFDLVLALSERMAALLEGSQLDAFSGERVERATEFYNSLPEKEVWVHNSNLLSSSVFVCVY